MKNGYSVVENLFIRSRNHYLKGHKMRAKIYQQAIRLICSCDIYPQTQIHQSVRFMHNGLGCAINPETIIDENVKVYQNVTIGGNPNGKALPGLRMQVSAGAHRDRPGFG